MSPKSPRDDAGGPRWIPAFAVGKEHWALGIHQFYSRWEQTCSLSLETLTSFLNVASCTHNPEKWPRWGVVRAWHTEQECIGILRANAWLCLPTFMNLYQYILMDFYFIQSTTIIVCLASGRPFKMLSMSFCYVPVILWSFSYFLAQDISGCVSFLGLLP